MERDYKIEDRVHTVRGTVRSTAPEAYGSLPLISEKSGQGHKIRTAGPGQAGWGVIRIGFLPDAYQRGGGV